MTSDGFDLTPVAPSSSVGPEEPDLPSPSSGPPVTVVVVDDHALIRTGLRTCIELWDDVRIIGEATDGSAGVDLVARVDPDVVLMDLSMPVLDGITATARLRELGARCRVVALTSFADRARVRAAIAAGAVGYLLKDSEPSQIRQAIHAAHAGHVPLDPRVAGALLPEVAAASAAATAPATAPAVAAVAAPAGDGPELTLSTRERQVLALVGQGMANKQIARALGISEATVKAHLGRVFRQLGVTDRTSAALWARDHDLT